ncbi:MAG: glycosyltransferase family 2 protein [Blastocatellia bacterium]
MKEGLFARSDYLAFALLTCLSMGAIVFFLVHWFSFGDWLAYPLSFSILTLIVFVKVANSQTRWFTLLFMKRPRPIAPRSGLKVGVITTIVPGAEPLEMLEETVRALVSLDYPHDTWVLDEGDDEEVKALCRKAGAFHFSRKNSPHYQTDGGVFQVRSKHGNYNAWLDEIGYDRYEIIAAFDPDHVPAPSFLTNVLGYFEDPGVGYVQAAQAYYNQRVNFIARGAAEETYEYYSCTQMASYCFDQPAVVGCHNTHRVKALREVGGFAAHDADDLLIGLRYQACGWRGVYVPRILARGLTPVDWDGYLTQQLRWARSVIDVKCRLRQLVGKKIPLIGQALSALHGFFYLQNSVTTFLGLLLLIYMLVTGAVPPVVGVDTLLKLALLCAALQACAFYRQKFYLDPRAEWGTYWRAELLRYAKWPVFLLALWQAAVERRVPYALTRKVRKESRSRMLVIPHVLVIVTVCAACVTGVLLNHRVPSLLCWVAAAVVTASFALILTSRLHFPAPYDGSLLSSQRDGDKNIPPLDDPRPYGGNLGDPG